MLNSGHCSFIVVVFYSSILVTNILEILLPCFRKIGDNTSVTVYIPGVMDESLRSSLIVNSSLVVENVFTEFITPFLIADGLLSFQECELIESEVSCIHNVL